LDGHAASDPDGPEALDLPALVDLLEDLLHEGGHVHAELADTSLALLVHQREGAELALPLAGRAFLREVGDALEGVLQHHLQFRGLDRDGLGWLGELGAPAPFHLQLEVRGDLLELYCEVLYHYFARFLLGRHLN